MKWYIAKLVFNIHTNNGVGNSSQFDEQFRLIEASSQGDAFFRARALGNKEEESFVNANGDNITWKFIDVSDVQPVNEFKHGAEIYSITHRDEQPDDYINFIRQKVMVIQSREFIFA